MFESIRIASDFRPKEKAVLFHGDCMDLLLDATDEIIQLPARGKAYYGE
jgi:hypothetical protein